MLGKEAGKIGKVTSLGDSVKLTRFSEHIPPISSPLSLKDRFAFAGISPLKNERPTIKDLFVTVCRVNSKGVNNTTTKSFEVTKVEEKNSHESRGASLKEIKYTKISTSNQSKNDAIDR
ncbi:hypothetical protein [Bacillus cereus]|nr:hypothetical protein [Bacillus cereus]